MSIRLLVEVDSFARVVDRGASKTPMIRTCSTVPLATQEFYPCVLGPDAIYSKPSPSREESCTPFHFFNTMKCLEFSSDAFPTNRYQEITVSNPIRVEIPSSKDSCVFA